MASVKEILIKLNNQLKDGSVNIEANENGSWTFYSTMQLSNTMLTDKNFISACENYLEVAKTFYATEKSALDLTPAGFEEKIILFLLFNMSNFDINNPIAYVQERTKMLSDNSPLKTYQKIGEFEGCTITLKAVQNSSNMESPMHAEISLTDNDGNTFILPKIGYGIVGDIVKIYYVQALKEKQENPLAKKLDRFFRKVNKDVDTEDIIYEISPNALVSLTMFLKVMKDNGKTNVVFESFLPERYEANKQAILNKTKTTVETNEMLEKHDRNQYNITNKLMNLALRYAYHFNADCNYDETTQQMLLSIENLEESGDNLIYSINSSVGELNNDLGKGI